MRPTLDESERAVVRDEVLSLHQGKWTVHALAVMPDHVHVLATPLERETGQWYSLSEILRSIKMGSALRVNQARGVRGRLWQIESFDRIIRDDREFREKEGYIIENAMRAGLVDDPWSYDGLWHPTIALPGSAGPRPAQEDPGVQPPPSRVPGIPPGAFVARRRRKLPHWQVAGATHFVTFRLWR